jgi:hypothetical protein
VATQPKPTGYRWEAESDEPPLVTTIVAVEPTVSVELVLADRDVAH